VSLPEARCAPVLRQNLIAGEITGLRGQGSGLRSQRRRDKLDGVSVFPRLYVVILTALFRLLRLCAGSKADLVLENVAFRHQIEVLKRGRPRSSLTCADRALWVLLRRWWPSWREALEIVKPGTVERWHRLGLSGLWRNYSKKHRGGRPRVATEIRDLIHRMAHDNFTWGRLASTASC